MNPAPTLPTRSTLDRGEPVDPSGRVSIRPIDAADASGLADFYAALTPRSRRQRFLGRSHPPTEVQLAELARAPGVVAVLSERGRRDGEIVAHASLHPDGDGGAEIAFAVADDQQGRRIGSRLMREIVAIARRLRLHRINAILYADNAPMRRMLVHAGPPLAGDDIEAGTEEITLDLDRAA
jgi:RimJ/RimL family protein N-acetyltransferase